MYRRSITNSWWQNLTIGCDVTLTICLCFECMSAQLWTDLQYHILYAPLHIRITIFLHRSSAEYSFTLFIIIQFCITIKLLIINLNYYY